MPIPVLVSTGRALLSGGSFSPLQLPNLKLWLKADVGVQARGGSQFTAASSMSLTRADNAGLSTGDVDFGWACWFYSDSDGDHNLVGKGTAGQYEFQGYRKNADGKLRTEILNGAGSSIGTVDSAASVSNSAWHHVVFYHDAVNDLVGQSLDGATFRTSATSGAPVDGTAAFAIGALNTASQFWDGRIAHFVFFKSPPGGIAAIANTIRDALYNSGNGLDVGLLSSAQRTDWGVISAWRLQEGSTGTRADSFGGNTLTNTGSVTGADGPFYVACIDGDPVARWLDQSGQGNHLTQATATKRPTYKTNIVNGRPVVRFNATGGLSGAATFAATLFSMGASAIYRGSIVGTGNNKGLLQYGVQFTNGAALASDGSTPVNRSLQIYSQAAAQDGNMTNSWEVWSGRRRTSPSTLSEFFLNGVSSASTNTANIIASTGPLRVGEEQAGGGFWNGDIETAYLCSVDLSNAQQFMMDRYMGQRIGVTV